MTLVIATTATPQQLATQRLMRSVLEVQQVASAIRARSSGDSIDASVSGVAFLFDLPAHISAAQLAQHLAVIHANAALLESAKVALEALFDAVWALLSHLVSLTAAACTVTTLPVVEGINSSASSQSTQLQEAAQRVFANQTSVLLTPLVALTLNLVQRYFAAIAFSPPQHGADILEWCAKLTPWSVSDQKKKDQISNSIGTHDNVSHLAHADAVVHLWSVLSGICAALRQEINNGNSSSSPASTVSAPAYRAQCADVFAGTVAYFLGSGARSFARSDAAAATAWCGHAVSVLPIVDEHYSNSAEVFQQVLFEHVPAVLSARFPVEQMAVIVAQLFATVFARRQAQKKAGGGATVVEVSNIPQCISVKDNVAFAAFELLGGGGKNTSAASSTSFASQPAHCAIACLVAVACSPAFGGGPSSPAAYSLDSSPLLAAAFRRCWSDGRQIADPASSGLARCVFLLMLQRLDYQGQLAALTAARPPWDHRFQLLSSCCLTPENQQLLPLPRSNEDDDAVGNRDEKMMQTIVDWCTRVLLEHPPPDWYQMPARSESNGASNAFPSAAVRAEFQRLLVAPFVDGMDLVAAQSPVGADICAAAILKSIVRSMDAATTIQNNSNLSNNNKNNIRSADTTAVLSTLVKSPESTASILSMSISSSSGTSGGRSSCLNPARKSALDVPGTNPRRFLPVRANAVINIVEKIRRSLYSPIDAAAPWGKLVPRRLYSETALAFYDIVSLAFSLFASDALALKDNNAFTQNMMQVTQRLIPLAQPFCLAALESATTVGQLIDRFERSMKDVETGAHARLTLQNQSAATPSEDTRASLTYKYLVASFTLSSMTDQRGVRLMPNDVFSERWVPLLSRACSAIEQDAVTRSLLQVHCRNCCSALLLSRRTVCPPGILEQKESSVATSALYSGPFTTDGFIRHASTFLGWAISPLVAQNGATSKSAVTTRRLAANTFAGVFAGCIESVERLESADASAATAATAASSKATILRASGSLSQHLPGSVIATNAVSQAGAALVSQIRNTVLQITDSKERAVYVDGSTLFAQGFCGCVACLDPKVRETAQGLVDQIMSSSAGVFPLANKKRVLDRMVNAVGMSKFLRGDDRDKAAMWLAVNEPKWMKEEDDSKWSTTTVLKLMPNPWISKL